MPGKLWKEYARTYEERYGGFKDYTREVRFLREIFEVHGDGTDMSVLDLACGTGTHIVQLAQAGYACAALDFNSEMLEKLHDKSEKAEVFVALYQGDMRTFRINRRFSAVINMFYSFQDALHTEKDQEMCLRAVRSALEEGGIFVVELLPEENNLLRYPLGGVFEILREMREDGVLYVVSSSNRLLNDDLKEISFTFTWSREGKIIRKSRTKTVLKRMDLETINRLFNTCGFTSLARYGDYSAEVPFAPDSEKMIAVFSV